MLRDGALTGRLARICDWLVEAGVFEDVELEDAGGPSC